MVLSKPQIFLTKFNDKYEVCCHGSSCATAPPTSFKAWYIILKAYKKTEYVYLSYLLSLCNNIHIKILETQKILIIVLSMRIVNEYINTTSLMSKHNY